MPRPLSMHGALGGLVAIVWTASLAVAASNNPPAPLKEQPNDIAYPSVAAALADLRTRPGVEISTVRGWTIIADKAAHTVWSFTPEDHAAHPAVVKRQAIDQPGGSVLRMSVKCGASKAACDDLVREFEALNKQAFAHVARPAVEPDVRTAPMKGGGYRLTLTAPGLSQPEQGQRLLIPTALRLCAPQPPQFGKYRWKSDTHIAKDGTRTLGAFVLTQEVSCGPAHPSPPPAAGATAQGVSPDDDAAVGELTGRYFGLLARGDLRLAFDLSRQAIEQGTEFETWAASERAFRKSAGEPGAFRVVKVTRYQDPPNAPGPGLYIAVDYAAEHANLAFECGYVVWRRNGAGPFGIVRHERGFVTREVAAKSDAGQLTQFRAQMRCPAS